MNSSNTGNGGRTSVPGLVSARVPQNTSPERNTPPLRGVFPGLVFDTSPDSDRWVLELKPTTDPLSRRGFPERPIAVRMRLALKELLRVHGFKVVCIRNPTPSEVKP